MRPSAALGIVLDRVRTRFGVGFELLNADLSPSLPEKGGELFRLLRDSPQLREQLDSLIGSVRAGQITAGNDRLFLQPVRTANHRRRVAGVLVARVEASAGKEPGDAPRDAAALERWSDFLRMVVEADLTAAETLHDERLRSRRVSAVLRFLGQLVAIDTESELMRAVVHAAAVWFDVEARIYRRDLAGDFVLHTHLPGVQAAPGTSRLSSLLVGNPGRMVRVSATEAVEDLRWAAGDVLLMPIRLDDLTEWVLAFGGQLSPEIETVFETVGQTLRAHLSRLMTRRVAAFHEVFQRLLVGGDRPPQLVAVDVLRRVIDETGAASGVLTLHGSAGVRRLAAFGPAIAESAPPSTPLLAFDQFLYPVAAHGTQAVFELRAPADTPFTSDGALVLREAAKSFELWLGGAAPQFVEAFAARVHDTTALFVDRIAEELERAKRFDLELSMLLIDLDGAQTPSRSTVDRILATVRKELRGSDLLGRLDDGRIAVLLVHTDVHGVTSVVPRIRQRLAKAGAAMGVPTPKLGRAVFSDGCRTTAALLSQAARDLSAGEPGRMAQGEASAT